jgi:hypothetical protein
MFGVSFVIYVVVLWVKVPCGLVSGTEHVVFICIVKGQQYVVINRSCLHIRLHGVIIHTITVRLFTDTKTTQLMC